MGEEEKNCMRDGTVPHCVPAQSEKPDSVEVVVGGKKCKCGSTTHQRISHHKWPLTL